MGHFGLKRGQNEVLGHFHVQNALVCANFAYHDRELWYLVVSGGRSAEKKLSGPKMGHLGPILAQKVVLVGFLEFGWFFLCDIAHNET